jgi:hypothetical protein
MRVLEIITRLILTNSNWKPPFSLKNKLSLWFYLKNLLVNFPSSMPTNKVDSKPQKSWIAPSNVSVDILEKVKKRQVSHACIENFLGWLFCHDKDLLSRYNCIHTSWSQNNKWQKCVSIIVRMGLNYFDLWVSITLTYNSFTSHDWGKKMISFLD